MRTFRISPDVVDGDTGYISRTISKSMLASAPVTAWTQYFHKPYAFDWKEAREKALAHCKHRAIICDSVVKGEH